MILIELKRYRKLFDLLFKFSLFVLLITIISCSTTKLPSNCKSNCNDVPDSLKSALFVFAHQDDEVFIVTRIVEHLRQNDSVTCIWLSKSYFRGEKYKEKRISESKSALKLLGIKSHNLFFLDLPDGETQNHIPEIIMKLKPLISMVDPDVVYVPAFELGHIDHDITNFTTVQSIKELAMNPSIYEFPLYNVYHTSKIIPFKVRQLPDSLNTCCRILTKDEFNNVLNFWYLYPSQYYPLDPFIRYTVGYRKAFGIEYYRKVPDYNYLEKPFEADAAYERFLKGVTYQDFHIAVKKYLSK